ncbi:MAG: hypothetical protein AAFY48_18715 [Bacteroidota bacterium]
MSYRIHVNPALANVNPIWASFGPDVEGSYPTSNGNAGGTGWDRTIDRAQDGIGVVNSLWCLLKPNRPGCNPNITSNSQGAQPPVATNTVPQWVWIMVALMFFVLLVILIKK